MFSAQTWELYEANILQQYSDITQPSKIFLPLSAKWAGKTFTNKEMMLTRLWLKEKETFEIAETTSLLIEKQCWHGYERQKRKQFKGQ